MLLLMDLINPWVVSSWLGFAEQVTTLQSLGFLLFPSCYAFIHVIIVSGGGIQIARPNVPICLVTGPPGEYLDPNALSNLSWMYRRTTGALLTPVWTYHTPPVGSWNLSLRLDSVSN